MIKIYSYFSISASRVRKTISLFDKVARIFEFDAGYCSETHRVTKPNHPEQICWSSSGRRFAIANYKGDIVAYDSDTVEELFKHQGSASYSCKMHFHDEDTLFSLEAEGSDSLYILDIAHKKKQRFNTGMENYQTYSLDDNNALIFSCGIRNFPKGDDERMSRPSEEADFSFFHAIKDDRGGWNLEKVYTSNPEMACSASSGPLVDGEIFIFGEQHYLSEYKGIRKNAVTYKFDTQTYRLDVWDGWSALALPQSQKMHQFNRAADKILAEINRDCYQIIDANNGEVLYGLKMSKPLEWIGFVGPEDDVLMLMKGELYLVPLEKFMLLRSPSEIVQYKQKMLDYQAAAKEKSKNVQFDSFRFYLLERVKDAIEQWGSADLQAIGFTVNANDSHRSEGFRNLPDFVVNYFPSSFPEGQDADELWEPTKMEGDTVIILPSLPSDDGTKRMLQWFREQGLTANNVDSNKVDSQELIDRMEARVDLFMTAVADVARTLQDSGYLNGRFNHVVPIIIYELEMTARSFEMTQRANPNGEANDILNLLVI